MKPISAMTQAELAAFVQSYLRKKQDLCDLIRQGSCIHQAVKGGNLSQN